MHYHRLHADADGASHWQTVDVALTERSFAPPAKAIEISDSQPARAMLFLRLGPGWNEPVHPSPVRQYLVCTTGRARVTASDGEAREVGPGDIWLMEDTTGAGHHTEVIGDVPFESIIVQLG